MSKLFSVALAVNRVWQRFTFRGGCRSCIADLSDIELDCGLRNCFGCNNRGGNR